MSPADGSLVERASVCSSSREGSGPRRFGSRRTYRRSPDCSFGTPWPTDRAWWGPALAHLRLDEREIFPRPDERVPLVELPLHEQAVELGPVIWPQSAPETRYCGGATDEIGSIWRNPRRRTVSRTPVRGAVRSCARTAILRASSCVTSTPVARSSTSYSRNSRRRRAGCSRSAAERGSSRSRWPSAGYEVVAIDPEAPEGDDLPTDDDRGLRRSGPVRRGFRQPLAPPRPRPRRSARQARPPPARPTDPERARLGPPRADDARVGGGARGPARLRRDEGRARRAFEERFFEWRPYPSTGRTSQAWAFATSAFRASARSGQPGRRAASRWPRSPRSRHRRRTGPAGTRRRLPGRWR